MDKSLEFRPWCISWFKKEERIYAQNNYKNYWADKNNNAKYEKTICHFVHKILPFQKLWWGSSAFGLFECKTSESFWWFLSRFYEAEILQSVLIKIFCRFSIPILKSPFSYLTLKKFLDFIIRYLWIKSKSNLGSKNFASSARR